MLQDKTGLAMEAMMAILALIEGIITIWSSVVCCTIGACCCSCGDSCCCPPSPTQTQVSALASIYEAYATYAHSDYAVGLYM